MALLSEMMMSSDCSFPSLRSKRMYIMLIQPASSDIFAEDDHPLILYSSAKAQHHIFCAASTASSGKFHKKGKKEKEGYTEISSKSACARVL